MRTRLAFLGLALLVTVVVSCAPNRASASRMSSEVRIAQEPDVLPQSCRPAGTLPVERRETLKRRVVAARANLVRYPLRNGVVPIYRCDVADIQKFLVWNAGEVRF
jgi:hypothetical protein